MSRYQHHYISLSRRSRLMIRHIAYKQYFVVKRPFYWYGLTLYPVWISYHIPSKVCDELLTRCSRLSLGLSDFIPRLIMDIITYTCRNQSYYMLVKGSLLQFIVSQGVVTYIRSCEITPTTIWDVIAWIWRSLLTWHITMCMKYWTRTCICIYFCLFKSVRHFRYSVNIVFFYHRF